MFGTLPPAAWHEPMGAAIINETTKGRISACAVVVGLVLGLSACTNPYDPAQRAIGGGLIGAGAGAAIGAAARGGHGAALGAAIGGGTGAVTGIATTPPPPGYYGYGHRRHAPRRRHKASPDTA